MPGDGPLILTDVRGPILVILGEACERRGRYNVERLMAQHGDAKLADLWVTLAERLGAVGQLRASDIVLQGPPISPNSLAQRYVGCKKNSKGYKETWTGYKLHIDVACGQIPVSCVLTSASVHDSQVAIPLMTMTSARVSYLYDLMDAAYDATAIHHHSQALGHAPIVDRNFRADHEGKAEWGREVKRQKLIHMPGFNDPIYDFRTMVERVNARLKDEFGARSLRVRGAAKVKCHLMFGILALAVDQIIRVVDLRPAPT